MNKNKTIKKIRSELKKNIDLKYKKGATNFFTEKIKIYGVRTPIVRKIGREIWKSEKVSILSKKDLFVLCEELLKSDYSEEATIAFEWARRLKKDFAKNDFVVFERWVKKYVNNWAKCDDFCTHAFGEILFMHPELFPKIKPWAKSKNRWERRASAVLMIYPTRYASKKSKKEGEKWLAKNFQIANALLTDEDDLVQKGYGWMLKEAANFYETEVFEYVMKKKNKMPRTALRYAIEKMGKERRRKAMS